MAELDAGCKVKIRIPNIFTCKLKSYSDYETIKGEK